MATAATVIQTADYKTQKKTWPHDGKHILAQFDDHSIVVYQAFNTNIAKYAVENQCFGGDEFSFTRMSWIKTNFLWMMYRCGWASKKNQERVLAVRITREGFEELLSKAYTAELQKSRKLQTKDVDVRLQWDPDHAPNYAKVPRRAIQLGLKGDTLRKYATEWIVSIEDITDFVHTQKKILDREGAESIKTAAERVYTVTNQSTASRIDVDFLDTPELVGWT